MVSKSVSRLNGMIFLAARLPKDPQSPNGLCCPGLPLARLIGFQSNLGDLNSIPGISIRGIPNMVPIQIKVVDAAGTIAEMQYVVLTELSPKDIVKIAAQMS